MGVQKTRYPNYEAEDEKTQYRGYGDTDKNPLARQNAASDPQQHQGKSQKKRHEPIVSGGYE